MKRPSIALYMSCLLALSTAAHAQSSNFVAQINNVWKTHNASNVLVFVESQLTSNPANAQVLTARAIVAAGLQTWGRGASNYLAQAVQVVSNSTAYSTSKRQKLIGEIQSLANSYGALADDASEPQNSQPQWNTNTHVFVFGEVGDEFPHISTLQLFNNP
jgi:hypothetical protein